MNVEEIQDFCLSLGTDVEEKLPFVKFKNGEGVLVFYVCGHMFCFFDLNDFQVISLKCQPERIDELKAQYDCVGNPYNESPKHWIGLDPHSSPDALTKDLIHNSYEIVKAKYTKKMMKKPENLNQYTHRYSLTAADMDTRYRMTPNAVLLYYQDCWARFMACLHLAAFDVVKQNRIWVITEFNAWFEEQTALWSDDIDVTVWNSEVSALRLYAEFRVRRLDGIEVAHGYGCWTLLDTEAHRLAPMTPFQPQIPVLPEMTSETHKKRRFPTDGTPLQQIEHRVNPINLDFNGHVNNRTYLSIAMQSADEAFMDAHAIRCLTIHWLKETFLGDTLTCRLNLLPNETDEPVYRYLHTIARNDAETAAQVYSEWVPRSEQIDVSVHASRK